ESITAQLQMQRREVVLWIEELETEGYDIDAWIESELQSMPDHDQERAWQAMHKQGVRYLKPVLQQMYSEEELKDKDVDQMYEWLRLLRLRFRKNQPNEVKAG